MSDLPIVVRGVFRDGVFCHVAAATPFGPHVTPMVFAEAGGRVWVTTSRGSVKARAWRSDPAVAGLVRAGARAVAFTGTASTHDALDPSTWARSAARGPLLAVATARFTRKNARFFAGYAADARRVPLAWTPPGRILVELRLETWTVLNEGRPALPSIADAGSSGEVPPHDRAGAPPTAGRTAVVPSADRFRAIRSGPSPFERLPEDVRTALGDGGGGALAVEGAHGPAVVPAAWALDGPGLYAVLSEQTLAFAAPASGRPRVALGMDRPSSWRARHMVGAMARGEGEIHVAARLSAGGRSARAIVAAAAPELAAAADVVVVRIRPGRFVWWRGWVSGTVAVA